LLEPLEDRDAVEIRKLVVQQHEIDAIARALERLASRGGLEHVIAFRPQTFGQGPADQLFIVDNKNRGVVRHVASLSYRSPAHIRGTGVEIFAQGGENLASRRASLGSAEARN